MQSLFLCFFSSAAFIFPFFIPIFSVFLRCETRADRMRFTLILPSVLWTIIGLVLVLHYSNFQCRAGGGILTALDLAAPWGTAERSLWCQCSRR